MPASATRPHSSTPFRPSPLPAARGRHHNGMLAVTFLAAALATLTPAPASAQDPASFRQTWRAEFEASARKVVALAEAMPAETYSWQPMEGVATVAGAYMHIARYNYMLPHRNMGVEPPEGVDYATFEEAFTTKDEVLEVLRASMDHVRAVVDGMSDDDMAAMVNLYGRDVAKWGVLFRLVSHMNEHLGQQIAYARSNRVVPPWSG